ncbi:hypothetical protein G6F57_016478 [Rhizopus arrhizus]|nr:hypothetical protein G6F57_016478 [Rhizopus arrhizus]
MTAVQAEEVMQYQHLAIALRAGADADGRHVHRRRDLGSDRGRHAFEHHDAGAGSGHGPGIFHQLARGIASALDLEATQAQHRLRGQAQMRADRDLALDQIADDVDLEAGTFDLDHLGTGLQQLQRGIQRAFGRSVGAKRQVGHQQRTLQYAGHGAGVVDHVGHGHRQGRIMALHDHPQRIADQDQVNAVCVKSAGKAGVVGGQHDQLLAIALGLGQGGNGPGLAVCVGAHVLITGGDNPGIITLSARSRRHPPASLHPARVHGREWPDPVRFRPVAPIRRHARAGTGAAPAARAGRVPARRTAAGPGPARAGPSAPPDHARGRSAAPVPASPAAAHRLAARYRPRPPH